MLEVIGHWDLGSHLNTEQAANTEVAEVPKIIHTETVSLMGKHSHKDQIFFLLLSSGVSAYLCQTHCLVSLLLCSAQSSMYVDGREPWQVRLRDVLRGPTLTNSRY